MIVAPHDLIKDALNNHYAIGAFNTSNLELSQAIIWAGREEKAPVIIQTSEGAIAYGGLATLSAITKTLAAEANIPVVLHLDHGKSLAMVEQCIQAGYSSVMIDLSEKPIQENIRLTRQIVAFAHQRGVWVEAELGSILGAEGMKKFGKDDKVPDEYLTDPRQVARFIEETGIDSLAISIGTIHGAFTGQEYIRFDLLSQIEKCLPDFPLVVHGASGIPADHLRQVATTNVCKVNIDTEIRLAFEQAVKAYFDQDHDFIDIRKILEPARAAAQKIVLDKIKLFGASNRV